MLYSIVQLLFLAPIKFIYCTVISDIVLGPVVDLDLEKLVVCR